MNTQKSSVVERLDIDPRFQGVWQLKAIISADEQVEEVPPNTIPPFYRVFATKIKLTGGEELIVNQVLATYIKRRMVNSIDFLNTAVKWYVTDVRDVISQGVVLQVLDSGDRDLEQMKLVFTVQV